MINNLADGFRMGLAGSFGGFSWLVHCPQVVVGRRRRRGGLLSYSAPG